MTGHLDRLWPQLSPQMRAPPVPKCVRVCVCVWVTNEPAGVSGGHRVHQGPPRLGLCTERRPAALGRPQVLLGGRGREGHCGAGRQATGAERPVPRHRVDTRASDWQPRGVCPLLNNSNGLKYPDSILGAGGVRAEQDPSPGHAGPPLEPADVPAVPRVEFPGKGASVYLELTAKGPKSL